VVLAEAVGEDPGVLAKLVDAGERIPAVDVVAGVAGTATGSQEREPTQVDSSRLPATPSGRLPGEQPADWIPAVQADWIPADLVTVPHVAALELRQQHAPRANLIRNGSQLGHDLPLVRVRVR
jgi:hypothetical protein